MKTQKETINEVLRFFIFGLTTTLVNIVSFRIMLMLQIDYRIANLVALLLSKMYAYITNKLFVFKSHCTNVKELFLEVARFITARGTTGIIDYFGMIVAVDILEIPVMISKWIIQIMVIILNFMLGRRVVFKQ